MRFPDLAADAIVAIDAIGDKVIAKGVIESIISTDVDIDTVCRCLRWATKHKIKIKTESLKRIIDRGHVEGIYWTLDYLHAEGDQSALPLLAGLDEHPNPRVSELAQRTREAIIRRPV
jgi:hypothetical protein